MAIIGIVQLSGRLRYVPPVPNLDSSSNPTWLSDVLESLTCSARKEEEYTLLTDAAVTVDLGSVAGSGVSLIVVKVSPNVGIPPTPGFPNGVPAAPNPITVTLGSAIGAAPMPCDPFLCIFSGRVPFTSVLLTRSPSVQTVVRVQLFAFGS